MSSKFSFSHGGSYEPSIAASGLEAIDVQFPFKYLFPNLANGSNSLLPADDPARTIADLKSLADHMVEPQDSADDDSNIPAVYTYWGQFIDHDITASDFTRLGHADDIHQPDFSPNPAAEVEANVKNRRRTQLDLDSLYGDGPSGEAADFYDGARLKVGTCTDIGRTPDPELGLDRDLPRPDAGSGDRTPRIGDTRNDENLVVAQFHTAWIRFHNAVVEWVEDNEGKSGNDLFFRAAQLVKHHYQWLLVHDYLKTITAAGTVEHILGMEQGDSVYNPPAHEVFMPLEYAVAVYRFGHSMVRARYDWNKNFGRNDDGTDNNDSTFEELFMFTSGGGMAGLPTLPTNWIAEWERLADHNSPFPDRFARKIDTHLAEPLATMRNEGNSLTDRTAQIIAKHLAMRNLLRGYWLSIPTGQAIAAVMGIAPLSEAEMMQGNSAALNSFLQSSGFLHRTPLFYYILKEAEVRENGNALGEMGSRIVAETLIGLLRIDDSSYLNQFASEWSPADGVKFDDGSEIRGIMDVFQFAGVATRD